MKQRTLGQGLTVSAIGMGCLTLSEMNYGPVDDRESELTLLEAVDSGITFLDTGEVYGRDSANEKLLGRVLRQRRDQVVLGTKFGLVYDYRQGPMVADSRPETIRASCEGSLGRLRTDHIDLYYQHRIDPRVPIEDVWGELSLLVGEGKVRFVGMSEPGIETLRRAHAIHPVAAVQSEYSLFTREPEDELMPVLEELGIGLVPFAPLGRGLLSGTIRTPDDFAPDDFRRRLPRYQGEAFYKNLELVDKVVAIAADRGATPAQLAIAWILSRRSYIVPIPGMETRPLLRENLKAADLELTQDELAAIEAVIPHGGYGDRYGQYASLQKAEAGK
jgi:aryl-alcohol dehydrogenase-like predicted oxidoreductase